MCKNPFYLYVEISRKRLKYLQRYREVAEEVKKFLREEIGDLKLFVFGSVVRGDYRPFSDIDILVVKDDVGREEMLKAIAEVRRRIGFDVPIEIHYATTNEFRNWYMRFIDVYEEI
ncbi:hypothetical protein DRN93_01345 [archaeon]|nr:MAG: hypothetical protein DRN93_01345 [archaeon]